MTTESNAAPGVAADTATPEPIANTQPEVATPESESTEQAQQTDADADSGDGADKSITRMERRLGRVTAARYQAEAEARQLREQLARFEQQAQPQGEEQSQRQQVDPYRLAEEIATAKLVTDKSNSTFHDGVKTYGESFKASVANVIEEAGPLINERGFPTALGEAVLDSEKPAALLHYLGKNPDVAESLQGLTAAQLGRRIAAIEQKMTSPEPRRSNAPPPLEPVKAGGKVQKAPSEMSDKEFAEYRRAQIAKRR